MTQVVLRMAAVLLGSFAIALVVISLFDVQDKSWRLGIVVAVMVALTIVANNSFRFLTPR